MVLLAESGGRQMAESSLLSDAVVEDLDAALPQDPISRPTARRMVEFDLFFGVDRSSAAGDLAHGLTAGQRPSALPLPCDTEASDRALSRRARIP